MPYGMLLSTGAPMTDPWGGVPVSFDTIDEARELWQPGFTIVRLVDDPDTEDGIKYVLVLGEGE